MSKRSNINATRKVHQPLAAKGLVGLIAEDHGFYVVVNTVLLMTVVFLSMKTTGRLLSTDADTKRLVENWLSPVFSLVSPLLVAIVSRIFGNKDNTSWQNVVSNWGKFKVLLVLAAATVVLNGLSAKVNDVCYGLPKAKGEDQILVLFAVFPQKNETADLINSWPMILRNEIIRKIRGESFKVAILPETRVIETVEAAEKLNECSGAAMTIWGTVYHDKIEVNYTSPQLDEKSLKTYLRGTSFPQQVKPEWGVVDMASFNMFITSAGDTEYVLNVVLGELRLANADFEEAGELFSNALASVSPERMRLLHADNILSLRAMYDSSKTVQEQIDDVSLAISINPEEPGYYVDRGIRYEALGEIDLALDDFNQAIFLDSDNGLNYLLRGSVFESMGMYDAALADYNIAVEKGNPLQLGSSAFEFRGRLYAKYGQLELALADFNEAIRLAPDNPDRYYDRGRVYLKLGQVDLAIEDFSLMLGFDPFLLPHELALVDRGAAYHLIGENELAIADFNSVISTNMYPDLTYLAYIDRALVYVDFDRDDLAVADYSEAIRLLPNTPVAYYHRGFAYGRLKLYDLALLDLERFIALSGSTDPQVLELIAGLKKQLGS